MPSADEVEGAAGSVMEGESAVESASSSGVGRAREDNRVRTRFEGIDGSPDRDLFLGMLSGLDKANYQRGTAGKDREAVLSFKSLNERSVAHCALCNAQLTLNLKPSNLSIYAFIPGIYYIK
jgi:hypothetical protein